MKAKHAIFRIFLLLPILLMLQGGGCPSDSDQTPSNEPYVVGLVNLTNGGGVDLDISGNQVVNDLPANSASCPQTVQPNGGNNTAAVRDGSTVKATASGPNSRGAGASTAYLYFNDDTELKLRPVPVQLLPAQNSVLVVLQAVRPGSGGPSSRAHHVILTPAGVAANPASPPLIWTSSALRDGTGNIKVPIGRFRLTLLQSASSDGPFTPVTFREFGTEGSLGNLYVIDINARVAEPTFKEVKLVPGCSAPANLPDIATSGRVGAGYSASLVSPATTGAIFSVSAGTLPEGLSLSGAGGIIGTPTLPGSFSFTIVATGATGVLASRAYVLTIAPAPAGPIRLRFANLSPGNPNLTFAESQTSTFFTTAVDYPDVTAFENYAPGDRRIRIIRADREIDGDKVYPFVPSEQVTAVTTGSDLNDVELRVVRRPQSATPPAGHATIRFLSGMSSFGTTLAVAYAPVGSNGAGIEIVPSLPYLGEAQAATIPAGTWDLIIRAEGGGGALFRTTITVAAGRNYISVPVSPNGVRGSFRIFED